MGKSGKKYELNIQKYMELVADDCKNHKTTLENVKSYVQTCSARKFWNNF